MATVLDITGQKFGRLKALKLSGKKGREWQWKCICDCGKKHVVSGSLLRSLKVKSCGCLRTDKSKTHNMSKTRVYKIWSSMISRCTRESSVNYHRYGGRGISVCGRWLKFENFYEDMGDDNGLSLDRRDNNGNYETGNCKWSTPKEQANNTRNNRMLTIDGETKTLSQWADLTDISYGAIQSRLNSGKTHKYSVFGKSILRPHKINGEFVKVVKYYHQKGYTITKLASIHNVSRTLVRKALAGGASSRPF